MAYIYSICPLESSVHKRRYSLFIKHKKNCVCIESDPVHLLYVFSFVQRHTTVVSIKKDEQDDAEDLAEEKTIRAVFAQMKVHLLISC